MSSASSHDYTRVFKSSITQSVHIGVSYPIVSTCLQVYFEYSSPLFITCQPSSVTVEVCKVRPRSNLPRKHPKHDANLNSNQLSPRNTTNFETNTVVDQSSSVPQLLRIPSPLSSRSNLPLTNGLLSRSPNKKPNNTPNTTHNMASTPASSFIPVSGADGCSTCPEAAYFGLRGQVARLA